MIEFFTVLIIDYKLQNNDMETRVWFETERHCQAAMNENLVEPLYNYLLGLYGNDMMMRCYVTEEASHDLVRPKLRPKGLK
jgi:hypothetical protein